MRYLISVIRNLFLPLLILASGENLHAQITTAAAYANGTIVNYVRSWDAKAPQTDRTLILPGSSVDSFLMTTQYIDGLGRPIQTVAKQMSPLHNDLVTPFVYDLYGREQYKYLPFVSTSLTVGNITNDGNFKTNPFQQDSAFSKIQYPDETYYYSKTVFESSSLERPITSYSPGNNWVGASRGVGVQYYNNAVSDSVRIWTIADANASVPSTSATYAAGTLIKSITTDENNNQVVEYKDKLGKIVLKKVQLSGSPGTAHIGWLCTYYIYDDFENLKMVLQPRAVELLLAAGNWTVTTTIRDELSFYYSYDDKKRVIVKKVPGAGEVYMIYDARDRLVMTQDSLLRSASKWLVTLYDSLNRPVQTGLVNNSAVGSKSFATHLSDAYSSVAYPFAISSIPGSGYEELTQMGYDNYSNLPSGASSGSIDNTYITSTNFFTTYNAYPDYAQSVTQNTQQTGAVTWSKVKVLGTASTFIYSTTIYDEKGRMIQVKSVNVSGGTDIITNQYDFSGKVVRNHVFHQKSGTNTVTLQILTKTTYDHAGRVSTITKRANRNGSSNTTDHTIVQYSYYETGQLKTKKIGAAPLDSMYYEYNIRGWTLGMNRSYVKDTTSTTNWFGFDLGYDKISFTVNGSSKSYAAAQYNGNIEGMLWKSTGDDQLRKYDFTYDAVNRLTGADFNQLTNNSFSKSAGVDFSVSGLNYDANGNILNMNQRGWKIGGSQTIDSLLYTYINNSNKLLNVLDRKNDTATRLGDFRSSKTYMTALSDTKTTSATDYSYDANGNMYIDNNKDIGNIHYNFLNLPDSITVTGKGNIKYVYDATGNKLKKITTEGSKVTTTLYLMGNYVSDTLQFLPLEEGKIRYNISDSSLQYDYFLKDHLGNVRMVLTEQQQTDAYCVASLETTPLANEKLYYAGLDTGRVNKSTVSGYPNNDTYTNPNDFIQKLNGNGAKIGASIVLKVMAGDKFSLFVKSWWNSGNSPGAPESPLNDLLSALAGNVGALPGNHATATEITNSGVLSPNMTGFLNSQSSYTTSKPKAFINWVLFDERFNYVGSSSGFEQVGNSNTLTQHTRSNLMLDKSGYLYIYVSNETPNIDVFFDNLQVTHIRGPLLEETHYYPFGLTMASISSTAQNFGKPNNKKKYNSIEYENSLDINIGEAFYRLNDPQLGRWWQIDPKPALGESLYSAMSNNPIQISDPLGDTTWVYDITGTFINMIRDGKNNNQTHFIDRTEYDDLASKDKSEKSLGKDVRKNSKAFIGKNSIKSLKKIVNDPKNKNKEGLFVGKIGANRELSFSQVDVPDNFRGAYGISTPEDATDHTGQYWIDKAYPNVADQANLFMIGHTHTEEAFNYYNGVTKNSLYSGSPMEKLKRWAHPSSGGDYNTANLHRGKIPQMVAVPTGISLFSQGESVDDKNGYQLYKQYQH